MNMIRRSILNVERGRRIVGVTFPVIRKFSDTDTNSFVSVREDKDIKGLSIVTLQKKPVNTFCEECLNQVTDAIHKIESDEQNKAIIITSAFPGVYSAGLDLNGLAGKTPSEIIEFWKSLQNMWLKLYSSPLITVAAINGHSIAAGCALAIACDYRIMSAGDYNIGLTVTRIGIPVPFWLRSCLADVIGTRQAEKAASLGLLFKSQQALDMGLVDEIVPMEQVLPSAREQVPKWLEIPEHSRVAVKLGMRENLINELMSKKDTEAEEAVDVVQLESVQTNLRNALETLRMRKYSKSR